MFGECKKKILTGELSYFREIFINLYQKKELNLSYFQIKFDF